MTNQLLGGFITDVHTMVQEAKLRLFDLAMSKKGGTLGGLWNACVSVSSARIRRTSPSSLPVTMPGL
jgi:hypothetical protein